MAGLITAHRLENGEIRPFAGRRRTVSLEHQRHLIAQGAELLESRADHMARHQRRGSLAKRASLHVMGEIDHPTVLDAKIDHDRRAAEPRMRLGGGVRICEPPEPGNIRRQLEDTPIVDVVDHPVPISVRPI